MNGTIQDFDHFYVTKYLLLTYSCVLIILLLTVPDIIKFIYYHCILPLTTVYFVSEYYTQFSIILSHINLCKGNSEFTVVSIIYSRETFV